MYVKKLPELDYGVSTTIKALGGKWKACILDCIYLEIRRPSEICRNITGLSLRVLNQQLKELEAGNIVYKKIYAEVPLRVEYYLTSWGESLWPVIVAMNEWGNAYRHHYGTES
ncbi:winged helix-turn-helix transcriptional regulator [Chitinophaga qingshengii]|uniref:Helix-turn-helix transcriptional regulator n=1 Tax=Chitinophaga qingshengii TaxID=1569794 RepID=A0ABR7TYU2_9BACT|nr:helix-turn-helix domain-containing protein [Chitinophaga qingshengii]MBC9934721.1 helix-turn-helix transcriptional regulator [Chitinophaga qingshengii]